MQSKPPELHSDFLNTNMIVYYVPAECQQCLETCVFCLLFMSWLSLSHDFFPLFCILFFYTALSFFSFLSSSPSPPPPLSPPPSYPPPPPPLLLLSSSSSSHKTFGMLVAWYIRSLKSTAYEHSPFTRIYFSLSPSPPLCLSLSFSLSHTHTHTHKQPAINESV